MAVPEYGIREEAVIEEREEAHNAVVAQQARSLVLHTVVWVEQSGPVGGVCIQAPARVDGALLQGADVALDLAQHY